MPRHLVNIHELADAELAALVASAANFKRQFKAGLNAPNEHLKLLGKLVTLLFSKRSTRTRISCEGAASYFGAHPMFLGKDDIQLGVNESAYDTTRVVSSMTSCIFARVNKNQDILDMAAASSVPIINSLCDLYHPLQAITDIMTIKESFGKTEGLKLAWIGDANNVINDLSIAALKSGMNVSVCIPESVKFNDLVLSKATEICARNNTKFEIVHQPETALNAADVVVTDTWISMGDEEKRAQILKQFTGYLITKALVERGNVNENWKFMHCLPRHKEEVDDEVFYSENSVVFEEAENRLYTAMAVLDGFVVKGGELKLEE